LATEIEGKAGGRGSLTGAGGRKSLTLQPGCAYPSGDSTLEIACYCFYVGSSVKPFFFGVTDHIPQHEKGYPFALGLITQNEAIFIRIQPGKSVSHCYISSSKNHFGGFRYANHTFNLLESLRRKDSGKLASIHPVLFQLQFYCQLAHFHARR
jgi:hypothetical protein